MHGEPDLWHALAGRLADIALTFLRAQVDAGVDAVQLFDSWAGALSERDYREFVLPHSAKVLGGLADAGVPRIHFGVGTGELLVAMREAGADVVGVDWRMPLDEAVAGWRRGARRPARSCRATSTRRCCSRRWPVLEAEVAADRREGKAAGGHIFNLGHGVLPETDPDVLTRVAGLVHGL